ncbi:MAG: FAD-binding oxidoreductase [Reichenbachiella sp.]
MWSFWEKESFIGQPDYIIIGSGIVGLSAAIQIKNKRPNSSILIIEAGHLPSGASTKNAGFTCFGSPSELLMDLEESNPKDVFELVKRRYDGLAALRETLGDKNIAYESPGSYELFTDKSSYDKTSHELHNLNQEALQVLGFSPYEIDSQIVDHLGFKDFSGAIRIHGEGQINTGKMMKSLISKALSLNIQIINGLKVREIFHEENHIDIVTDSGIIKCTKCLVATNGFAKKLLPDLDISPARAQVLLTKPIENLKIQGTFHFDRGYYYFRNIGDRILFGGGRNLDIKGEETSEMKINVNIQQKLKKVLSESILPNHNFEIAQQWVGIMGIGKEKKPILKEINSGLYCAARLGGMGIAIGTLVGQEVADLMVQ